MSLFPVISTFSKCGYVRALSLHSIQLSNSRCMNKMTFRNHPGFSTIVTNTNKMRHNKFVISNFCTHLRSTSDSTVESSSESSLQSNKDIAKSENSKNDVNSYPTIKSNEEEESIYQAQGLFAVYKPLEWTSQDVVSYIRGMLERDARSRGLKVEKLRKRGNKKRQFKVGHGGTLGEFKNIL